MARKGTTGIQNSAPRGKSRPGGITPTISTASSIEDHRRADDVGIGAEAAHPGAVVQHRHRGRVRHVVFSTEATSEQRVDAQRVEEPGRHAVEPDARRLAASLQDRAPVVRSHDGRARERLAGRGPFAQMPIGQLDHRLPALVGLPDDGEVLGRFDRQRPQQHGVDGAEDGAVGADREREGQDRGRRISGGLPQVAKRVTKIGDHSVVI